MPFRRPGSNSDYATTANIKYTKDGVTNVVKKIVFRSNSIDTDVWEKTGLTLNVCVRSIDYTSYPNQTHQWSANQVKKLIDNLKIEVKDSSGTVTTLVNMSSGAFSGTQYNLIGSNKKLVPGEDSIKVTVTCKDWCCVDKLQLNTSSSPTNTGGLEILKRNRTYGSDDATTTTTSSYKKVSSVTFASGTIYLWIELSSFHLYSQIDRNNSEIYLSADRYSDYYFLMGHAQMKTSGINFNYQKLYTKTTSVQGNKSLSREYTDESESGWYFLADGQVQQDTAILDPNSSTPIFYVIKIAPKENFISWDAPNIISVSGTFMNGDQGPRPLA